MSSIIAVLIILLLQTCHSNRVLKQDMVNAKELAAQNVTAMNDVLHHETNRANEAETSKAAFVTKLKDLKQMDRDLFDESQKEIGDLRAIIKGTITASQKPLAMSDLLEKYDSAHYGLKFDHRDPVWHVRGVSRFGLSGNTVFPDSTYLLENTVSINLVLGFKEDKDRYEIFARSSNPDVVINKLDGALFIPRKNDITCPPIPPQKRMGIGLHIGYGLSKDGIGPVVGVGLNYNLINF